MTNVSILGASGYAGGELCRLLLQHPQVNLKEVTSRKFTRLPLSLAHPNLRRQSSLNFIHPDQLSSADLLFVALPNTESMKIMPQLMKKFPKIIDLGADFRLRKASVFKKWYHLNHLAPKLLKQFTYGLAEIHRSNIKKSSYVACAGCEATVSILALYPLIKLGLIKSKIIIDAKMSSSQSGLNYSLSSHHPERANAVRSYLPSGHRHTAEILQELPSKNPLDVAISATALDLVRGLLVTIHTIPRKGLTEIDLWKAYRQTYGTEPFIRLVKEKQGLYRYPEPKILQGTNYCDIGFEIDQHSQRLVIIAAIDNLVKGTAGQAVQAMNLMLGFEETTSLTFSGLHPI